jgi:predicted transposase/invertase (TIGR01784 family)
VEEPFVASLTVEDLQAIDKSFISEEMINRESDIIYRVKKEGLEIYILVLVEFQSAPDATMPVRLLSYIMRLYEQLLANKQPLPLPPIFPLVLYNGAEPWRVADQIADVIAHRISEDLIPRFRYLTIRERDIPEEKLIALNNLVAAAMYMEKLEDGDALAAALDRIVEMVRNEELIDIQRFVAWARKVFGRPETEVLKTRIQSLSEVRPMLAQLADKLREEGREEGREQGLEKGRKEGTVRGSLEARTEIARRLLAKGMSNADVSEITGLSVEAVAALANE